MRRSSRAAPNARQHDKEKGVSDRTIYITDHDMKRLRQLLFDYRSGDTNGQYLKDLMTELDRACVVSAEDVPEDVITMNATVCVVDLDTHETLTYTLVFPQDADSRVGKISVLAPIGTAMLGYRVGDEFEWRVPAGVRRLKVKDVLYQPSSVGD
ncbi:MAG: nucleoside diphosphate kinase regulator [Anaerolineae bacterium]|nr:nucleoside diphosphate kinase regulator [Anaerolineae bacterium]